MIDTLPLHFARPAHRDTSFRDVGRRSLVYSRVLLYTRDERVRGRERERNGETRASLIAAWNCSQPTPRNRNLPDILRIRSDSGTEEENPAGCRLRSQTPVTRDAHRSFDLFSLLFLSFFSFFSSLSLSFCLSRTPFLPLRRYSTSLLVRRLPLGGEKKIKQKTVMIPFSGRQSRRFALLSYNRSRRTQGKKEERESERENTSEEPRDRFAREFLFIEDLISPRSSRADTPFRR